MRDFRGDLPDGPDDGDAGAGGVALRLSDYWVDDPDDWGTDPGDDLTDGSVPDEQPAEPDDQGGHGEHREPVGEPSTGDTQDPDPAAEDSDGQPDRPRFYVVDRPAVPEGRTGGYGDALTYRDGELVRPPLFDGQPKREDAVQGNLGDCGVIASMGAVAHHRPDAIKDLVRVRDDGLVEVHLHEATTTRYGAEPTGNRIPLLVTPEVPLEAGVPNASAFANSYRTGVAWPAMVEKAFAGVDLAWPSTQHDERGTGYTRLDHGSASQGRAEILTQLTGRPADVRVFDTSRSAESFTADSLRGLLDAGSPIVVGTRPGDRNGELPHRLRGLHAYEVAGVDDDMVSLHNPWGVRHPPPLQVRDFLANVQPYYTALRPEEDRT